MVHRWRRNRAFADRQSAGRELAAALDDLRDDPSAIVVGLPRGGVPVAAEVAAALDVPFDVIVVRKLGLPDHPEYAMGAIGEDDVVVIDRDVIGRVGISDRAVADVERRERRELDRRVERFRHGRSASSLAGRTVIVVDDGIATGSTVRAACQVARARGAKRVVIATPVAPHDGAARLADVADEFVALHAPRTFGAVGNFYRDFRQVSDREVMELVDRAADR